MNHQKKIRIKELEQPLDYLVIGHLTADLTNEGIKLGGTAAFSGLTAQALGLKTCILTSFSEDLETAGINSMWLINKPAQETTTFKNISDGATRKQYLYHIAEALTIDDLPYYQYAPKILHLGPVANEVDPAILYQFPNSLKCLTPQGWFRKRNKDNLVVLNLWKNWDEYFPIADLAVISIEDVNRNEELISRMASAIQVFVITENYLGARVYWHNEPRFFNAPEVEYADDTGAGDIFAAAFFVRYFMTKDPWEAGRFAVLLASWSVSRKHIDSIPTQEEVNKAKCELMAH